MSNGLVWRPDNNGANRSDGFCQTKTLTKINLERNKEEL